MKDTVSVTTNSAPTNSIPPKYDKIADNGIIVSQAPSVDKNTGDAVVTISSSTLDKALEQAKPDSNGVKTVTVEVKKAEGASGYIAELPSNAIVGASANQKVELVTNLGTITLPGNMVNPADVAGAKIVAIAIVQADKSKLDTAIQAQIWNRPVIELNLKADGKVVAWSNPDAPVTVSVAYNPTTEEVKDPEHIVVWYIDGNGKIQAVPNGKYAAATGKVLFTTTHFGKYAIAFVHKTFSDLGNYAWAKKKIEVMASKGVINGTSETTYTPSANITRAEAAVIIYNPYNQ